MEVLRASRKLTQKNCCQQCNLKGMRKQAQALCKTCKMGFCEDCAADHTKQPIFASHKLVLVFCKDHGGDFGYICKTCIVGLCAHCILAGDHETHEVQEKTTPIDLDANIQLKRAATGTKIANAKKAMKSIENDKTGRVGAWNRMATEILEHWDKLKAEGDKMLKDHLSVYQTSMITALQTYQEQFATGQAAIESGARLWKKNDTDFRVNRTWVEENLLQRVTSARKAVQTVPDPAYICMDVLQLTGLHKIPKILQWCRTKCDMSTVFEQLKEKPNLVTNVQYTVDSCKPGKSCHIFVKGNGAAIVCTGGQVYEIQTDGTRNVLQDAGKALISYQHENSMYFLQTDGSLFKMSDPGVKQHLIHLNVSPLMMYIARDVAHFFHETGIGRRELSGYSLGPPPPLYLKLTSKEKDSCLLVERLVLDGSCKFIAILKKSYDVVMLNEECKGLSRFSLHAEDGRKMDVLPGDMTVMANGHLLVANKRRANVLEFTLDGTFIRELNTGFAPCFSLSQADELAISYRHPCLWVVTGNRRGTRSFRNVSSSVDLVMRVALFRFDM